MIILPAGLFMVFIPVIVFVLILVTAKGHRRYYQQTVRRVCMRCGENHPGHARFCRKCGTRLN